MAVKCNLKIQYRIVYCESDLTFSWMMYLVTSDKFRQLEEVHLRNVSHGPPTDIEND